MDIRDSCFAELVNVIRSWGLLKLFDIPKGRSSELYMRCKNGNEILFYGLDDAEQRKSIQGITSVWIEEPTELEKSDYEQLDIRVRGKAVHYKQFILSFNPIYINHWLNGEFFDRRNPKRNCKTVHSTYKDNKFLDQESIEVLEGFKDKDPYFYQVYCQGSWGILGKTIFDAQKVSKRIEQIKDIKPLKEGFFEYDYVNEQIVSSSIRWIDEPGGYIKIYKDATHGNPYVIGGDTAGEGSDWFCGQVIDNVTSEQVAVLKHQFDEDLYARQMYCLGMYYNEALLGIETNFSTYPVKELQRLGYYAQFKREKEDTITQKMEYVFGFKTTKLTRPLIISNLVQLVREHVELFNDLETLEEMLSFVRSQSGRPEAQAGKNDDLIMGLAISYYCRNQQYTSAGSGSSIFIPGSSGTRHSRNFDTNFPDDDEDDDDDNVKSKGFYAI